MAKFGIFSQEELILRQNVFCCYFQLKMVEEKLSSLCIYFSTLVWISGPVGSQKIEKASLVGTNRATLFTSSYTEGTYN